MLSQCSDKLSLLQATLFSLWGECALLPRALLNTDTSHSSGGSCALSAASGTTCSFDIISHSCDHTFCPPSSWDASGMCLTTSLPHLQQHVWALVPREAQPGFLLSLQASLPWFCHLGVVSVASYSLGTPLSFTGPGLYHLLTADATAIFFSSQRFWIFYLFPNWYNAETQLTWQLWSFRDLITFYWNAVSVLVEFEGNSGKREVLCYRQKNINASFADETAAASEFFLWDVLCLGYILSFGAKDFLCKQVYLLLHMNKFCN